MPGLAEGIPQQPIDRFAARQCCNRENIKPVRNVMVTITQKIGVSRSNHSLLFPQTDSVFGRGVGVSSFHFDKHQLIPVPCNKVHFTFRNAVAGRDDPESQSSQIRSTIDL